MKTKQILWLIPVMMIFLAGAVLADRDSDRDYGKNEINETFSDIDAVRISTVSGNCEISATKGDKVTLDVFSSYRPRDTFEPVYRVKGKTLIIKEKMSGSNRGNSTWKISVPPNTRIKFSTASGDFEAWDITADISVETASGYVELMNCEGSFDLESASGDITLDNCRGEIEVETASGDIDAKDIIIKQPSFFNTASGDVYVVLAQTAEYDMELSTASGRIVLDYNGNPVKGFFEFIARKRRGRIDAPYDFDKVEEFERWDNDYVRKTFSLKGDTPEIILETASGKVALEK